MKAENRRAVARGIIHNGSWLVSDSSDMTLEDIEAIEKLVMFPLNIKRCAVMGWGLECKDILQERNNTFWWGQDAGDVAIENPMEWIKKRSKR